MKTAFTLLATTLLSGAIVAAPPSWRCIVEADESYEGAVDVMAAASITSGERIGAGFAVVESAVPCADLIKEAGVLFAEDDTEVSLLGGDDDDVWAGGPSSWGLDRIDGALDGVYHPPSSQGRGTNLYVLDTGVDGKHADFSGRVQRGADMMSTKKRKRYRPANVDCHGHGTHVGSTAAGVTYGIASKASVIPVRVLGCGGSGSTSGVINGVNWAVRHQRNTKRRNRKVIVMSLGGPASVTMNRAVDKAVAQGVVVVVAAGNSISDACLKSPAGAGLVVTVGATDKKDDRAAYSNHGSCVDIFAPGSGIRAALANSGDGSTLKSGTSMSAPHVAGAMLLLRENHPRAKPEALFELLSDRSEKGVVKDALSEANDMLHVGGEQV